MANNSKWNTSIFNMKQLSICGKQQQMTHKHVCHETVIHLWQTTANDTEAFLTWNSCPYVANNSKWHTSMFDMKQLSICGKQQQMTHEHFWHECVIHMWQQQQKTYNHVWHETVIHVLFIYLFKIYFTFLISQAVKLTFYTGRKTKIFTYNIRK